MAEQGLAEDKWERPSILAVARGLLLALTPIALIASLHLYIAQRIISGLGIGGGLAAVGWTVAGLLFFLIPAGIFARGLRWQRLAFALRWLAYIWIGLFALLLSTVALVDVASAIGDAATHYPGPRWGRLEVLVVLGLVVPAFAWGLRSATGPAKIERIRVPIPELAPALEGLRIVQLSDLHIGETLRRPFASRVVEQVNALAPDLVVITGDLADGSVHRLRDDVAPLAGLRARLGVYFVTGNHEYYSGVEAWEREVRRLGITVLHNEHRVLERDGALLVLAGVTDFNGGGFSPDHESSPEVAFAGAPAGVPRILLAHQPRSAFAAAAQGVDLQLSGHTHGGQLFPWMFFVRLQQPVLRGLRRIGGVLVYTHRGTGFWGPPLRVGAPPEIAELTLTRA